MKKQRRQHAYRPAIERLARELQATLPPGATARATVRHDPDCPKLRGEVCNCNFEIVLGQVAPGGDTPAPPLAERDVPWWAR